MALKLNEKPEPQFGNYSNQLSKEECLEMLYQLYLARYFDVRLVKEKKRGRLRGTLYSSHNQEGVLVGSLFALKPTDWISPIHRDMPAFFLKDLKSGWHNPDRKGIPIEKVCAQVWGKVDSPGRARDNWSHIGSKEHYIIHSTSMLASTIPVATGVVLADRLNGENNVVLAYNGEGATARGDFHEALNFAAVHKLPLIIVVENNMWAYGTPFHMTCATPNVADRAKGFGIPGVVADGQDVFDVYDKTMWCINHARKGEGPVILECKTYRSYGHGDHDDDRAAKYRPQDEIEQGRGRDPIAICKKRLLDLNYLTEKEASQYKSENKGVAEATDEDFPEEIVNYIKDAVEFAIQSPVPDGKEGELWVYRENK